MGIVGVSVVGQRRGQDRNRRGRKGNKVNEVQVSYISHCCIVFNCLIAKHGCTNMSLSGPSSSAHIVPTLEIFDDGGMFQHNILSYNSANSRKIHRRL
jgi:hypothetical protein